MGLESILPIKLPVTIGTVLNLYRAEFKINSESVRVNKAQRYCRIGAEDLDYAQMSELQNRYTGQFVADPLVVEHHTEPFMLEEVRLPHH